MTPLGSSTPEGIPQEYVTLARKRDRWFGIGIAAVIASLLILPLTNLFAPAWLLEPIVFCLFVYAISRQFVLAHRAGAILRPWLERHPYEGQFSSILRPIFAFARGYPSLFNLTLVLLGVALVVLLTIVHHMLR